MAGDIIGVNGDYIALTGANLPIKTTKKALSINRLISSLFYLPWISLASSLR
jgi:hypothetical protein